MCTETARPKYAWEELRRSRDMTAMPNGRSSNRCCRAGCALGARARPYYASRDCAAVHDARRPRAAGRYEKLSAGRDGPVHLLRRANRPGAGHNPFNLPRDPADRFEGRRRPKGDLNDVQPAGRERPSQRDSDLNLFDGQDRDHRNVESADEIRRSCCQVTIAASLLTPWLVFDRTARHQTRPRAFMVSSRLFPERIMRAAS